MIRTALFIVLAALLPLPAAAQDAVPPPPPPLQADAAAVELPTYKSLITDLGRDFKRLPSVENGVVLTVGGGLSYWAMSEDAEITWQAVTSRRLNGNMGAGAAAGSGWTHFGMAFGTFVIGKSLHQPRTARLGADLVRAQTMNALLVEGIKVAVDRSRPDGGRYSFPSGHTSSAFATAAVLQRHLGWKVGVPAYSAGIFVAWSRLQENRHYMSDVLFGAALGIVSGRTVSVGHGRGRIEAAPMVVPRGAGVQFTVGSNAAPSSH